MEFREILNVMKERPKQRTTDSGVNRKQSSKFFFKFYSKVFPTRGIDLQGINTYYILYRKWMVHALCCMIDNTRR